MVWLEINKRKKAPLTTMRSHLVLLWCLDHFTFPVVYLCMQWKHDVSMFLVFSMKNGCQLGILYNKVAIVCRSFLVLLLWLFLTVSPLQSENGRVLCSTFLSTNFISFHLDYDCPIFNNYELLETLHTSTVLKK